MNAKYPGNDPCTSPGLEHADGLISMRSWHRGYCDFGFHFGGLLLGLSVYSAGVVISSLFSLQEWSTHLSFTAVSHYCKKTHILWFSKVTEQEQHMASFFLSLNTVLNCHPAYFGDTGLHTFPENGHTV